MKKYFKNIIYIFIFLFIISSILLVSYFIFKKSTTTSVSNTTTIAPVNKIKFDINTSRCNSNLNSEACKNTICRFQEDVTEDDFKTSNKKDERFNALYSYPTFYTKDYDPKHPKNNPWRVNKIVSRIVYMNYDKTYSGSNMDSMGVFDSNVINGGYFGTQIWPHGNRPGDNDKDTYNIKAMFSIWGARKSTLKENPHCLYKCQDGRCPRDSQGNEINNGVQCKIENIIIKKNDILDIIVERDDTMKPIIYDDTTYYWWNCTLKNVTTNKTYDLGTILLKYLLLSKCNQFQEFPITSTGNCKTPHNFLVKKYAPRIYLDNTEIKIHNIPKINNKGTNCKDNRIFYCNVDNYGPYTIYGVGGYLKSS